MPRRSRRADARNAQIRRAETIDIAFGALANMTDPAPVPMRGLYADGLVQVPQSSRKHRASRPVRVTLTRDEERTPRERHRATRPGPDDPRHPGRDPQYGYYQRPK